MNGTEFAPVRPVMVRLVTRLVVAQTAVAAAVGLPFSRRHLPSVMITLALVLSLCLLVLVVRTGTRAAWATALGGEAVFFLYGLSRFLVARYVGGTLFSLVITVTLLLPSVVRAYSVLPEHVAAGPEPGEAHLSDTAG